jgi:hypothetical protein
MGCGSHLRWRSWYGDMGHLIQEMMGRTIKFYGWMYISLPFLVTKFSNYIKEFLGNFDLIIPVWLQDMFIGLGLPIMFLILAYMFKILAYMCKILVLVCKIFCQHGKSLG